ncbi:Uma2 family endonuclease [Actinoplanes sp. NPDC048988]|uniref:Uma2 family endonuclease n=1 Tax=Actinoplanes sp. NPDC048988 TaxID=3363901 RepID=UPI003711C1AA
MGDLPPEDGWTTDDLNAFPDDGVRRELLDGVLLVPPSRTDIHQIVAMRLMVALEGSCPIAYQVTQGMEVRIGRRCCFSPDVLVATDEAACRRPAFYEPQEIVLAAEIVSPASQSMDHITKKALYAASGIPHYWVIETDNGLVVHTHELDSRVRIYRPAITFDVEVDVPEPWPIRVPGTVKRTV